MRRLLKSWVFWVFVVPPAVLILGCGVLRQRDYSFCPCRSHRVETSWRLGLPKQGSISVTPAWPSDTPSDFFSDILGTAHTHAWRNNSGEIRSFLGLSGGYCFLMMEIPNVAYVYQRNPEFRSWLKQRVEAGGITPAAVEAELVKREFYPPGQFPFGWTPPP